MNWPTTLATLLIGGFIGAGSALLLDLVKSRRDLQQQWRGIRQEVYVDYLTELSKAYESLWALAHGDYDDSSKEPEAAAREIFRTSEIYQTRQRLKIIAPQQVIGPCDAAFNELKAFRIVVAAGATTQSQEFLAANQVYRTSVELLHKAIRGDLNLPGPSNV
jgi:hypothetical protein